MVDILLLGLWLYSGRDCILWCMCCFVLCVLVLLVCTALSLAFCIVFGVALHGQCVEGVEYCHWCVVVGVVFSEAWFVI